MSEELNPDTVSGMISLNQKISYYLNLRVAAKSHNEPDFPIPSDVDKIIELASSLPEPEVASWASLSVGQLPSKSKAKKSSGEGTAGRPSKFTEENTAELVRLVEDESFRSEKLGKEGTHQNHVNWAALARRYGFATPAPIHRQYATATGKAPPGVSKKEKKDGDDGAGPSPKKAKVAQDIATAASATNGWTEADVQKLIKLVEDESFRKAETGKRSLKWSRIAENLSKGKKESKKKYTEATGKSVED